MCFPDIKLFLIERFMIISEIAQYKQFTFLCYRSLKKISSQPNSDAVINLA